MLHGSLAVRVAVLACWVALVVFAARAVRGWGNVGCRLECISISPRRICCCPTAENVRIAFILDANIPNLVIDAIARRIRTVTLYLGNHLLDRWAGWGNYLILAH